MPTSPYFFTSLLAGDTEIPHRAIVLATPPADLPRGAVLGIVTASGKYVLSASAAGDGSQVPNAILAFDVPASAGADVPAAAYFMGEFVAEKLSFGAGHTAATVEASFRSQAAPIVVKSVGVIAYP